MRRNRLWVLSLMFLCGLVFACLANLRLTVLYDQTDELKAGDLTLPWPTEPGRVLGEIDADAYLPYYFKMTDFFAG